MFSFCDKLLSLLIKDIEAMDPSILKGEQGSGKKPKVPQCSSAEAFTHNMEVIHFNEHKLFKPHVAEVLNVAPFFHTYTFIISLVAE